MTSVDDLGSIPKPKLKKKKKIMRYESLSDQLLHLLEASELDKLVAQVTKSFPPAAFGKKDISDDFAILQMKGRDKDLHLVLWADSDLADRFAIVDSKTNKELFSSKDFKKFMAALKELV